MQHVSYVVNLTSQLSDLGLPQTSETVVAKILGSLTSKFGMLKIAWDSVEPARQTLENLQERLIKEDVRLNGEDQAASAFSVSVKREKNKKKEKVQQKGHQVL